MRFLKPNDEQERQNYMRSNAQAALVCGALALLVPVGLNFLFTRHATRLADLADHGQRIHARITQTDEKYAHYEYRVDGTAYTWSVSRNEAPLDPGEYFRVRILPEDPSFSRPESMVAPLALQSAEEGPLRDRVVLGVFGFFALATLACTIQRDLLKEGRRIRTDFLLGPELAGRMITLLMIGLFVGVTLFDEEVGAIQAKAFDAAFFDLPTRVVVAAAETILLLPYFWVNPHMMRIVFQALRDGASIGNVGLLLYLLRVAKAHPELSRSRNIALGGFAYLMALLAAWIMYAHHLGI